MPTYEYKCESCGREFELFQKMTDPPAETCPECGGSVRRKIGAGAGLIFKGTGFYATDYRSGDYKAKAHSERSVPAPSPKGDADSTKKPGPAKESKGD